MSRFQSHDLGTMHRSAGVYLIFNEGYSAKTTGAELSCEAIRLGRLLLDLLQLHLIQEPEVMGLLGLMLLQESRRAARTSPDGNLILLEQQDRSLWRHLARRKLSSRAPLRCLHFAGGHCRRSRREFLRGIHGLAVHCHVRRSGAGSLSYR